MLFKLSVSNIRKSIKDYAVYFFTLVIGVSIFYLFNSVEEQKAFTQFLSHAPEAGNVIKTLLKSMSAFVSVVLGLLIIYASRFLMKKRNKEFAIYLVLGMSKRKISAILLVETLLIGIGSLFAGLAIGIGLSQFMSALVSDLFEADVSSYEFIISTKAVRRTVINFGIAYLVVMLFNSMMISRCRLLDLLQAGKKSEKLKIKNPWLCIAIFIAAVCGLAYAYYTAAINQRDLTNKKLLLSIALGGICTLLVFWSISGLMLKLFMSVKKVYFKDLNSFTFRQISSKVNTTVLSMTIISLILFLTICTLSTCFAFRSALNKEFRECCPADFQLTMMNYEGLSEDNQHKEEYAKETPEELIEKAGIADVFDDTVSIDVFLQDKKTEGRTTVADLLGDHLSEVIKAHEDHGAFIDGIDNIGVRTVKISDYNALMELFGKETESISPDEYFILSDAQFFSDGFSKAAADGITINYSGHELHPAFGKALYNSIEMTATHETACIMVVDDSVLEGEIPKQRSFYGNYKAAGKDEKRSTDTEVVKTILQWQEDTYGPESYSYVFSYVTTRLAIADMCIGIGAMIIFVGLYLGLTFIITCAAIIALKQLSDCTDSYERYEILRRIGAEEKSISKSLFIQTAVFFFLPLTVALIHSIFGIKFCRTFLELFTSQNMLPSIIMTAAVIILIYGGYFVLTYLSGRSIIRNRRR